MGKRHKAVLVLDLGNSETRCRVLYGMGSNGQFSTKAFTLSNRFAEVDEGYELPAEYSTETSTVFQVDGVVDGNRVHGTYVNGEVQESEFSISPTRPSALIKKYNSETTLLSFTLALLHGYKAISEMCNNMPIEDLDIEWNITALLPPGDLEDGKNAMRELFKSTTTLNCTYPAVHKEITINNVMVLAECAMAYMAVRFKSMRKKRKETAYLDNETMLILDIGAGTTDMCVVRNGKLITASKRTFPRGCNQVLQKVRLALENDGIELDETAILKGIVDGKVRVGAKEISIVDIVIKERMQLAKSLRGDVQTYLESQNFVVQSINRILVCGGGAMRSTFTVDDEDETGEQTDGRSIADVLVQYFKAISKNIMPVDIPVQKVVEEDENGCDVVRTISVSPRELNILGAAIASEKMLVEGTESK